MTNQILTNTVTKILKEATLQRVRFVVSGLSVFGFGYEMVARAITRGAISCDVGVTPNQNLSRGYSAKCRYEPGNRRLLFPNEHYGLSPGTQTFDIVHEATHALFDCSYGRPAGFQVSATEDEVAAFLAMAIYSRVSQYLWSGPAIPGEPIDESLHLADKIMAVPNAFRDDGRPPYHVPPADLIPLRRSVQTQYNFVGGAAGIQHIYYGVP